MPPHYRLISGPRSTPYVSHGTAVLKTAVAKSSSGPRLRDEEVEEMSFRGQKCPWQLSEGSITLIIDI